MKHSFKHILQRFLGLLEFAIKSLLHYKFIISTKKILFTYITLGLPIFVGFTLLRFNIIPTANQYALSVDIQAGSWDTLTFFSFIAFLIVLCIILLFIDREEQREFQLKKIKTESADISSISGNDAIMKMIPSIKECLDSLKVKEAYRLFNNLREIAISQGRIDYRLLSLIDLYRSQCSRYFSPESSRLESKAAFDEMKKAFIFIEDIYSTEIYYLLKENNFKDALRISLELKERFPDSIWSYLPSLIKSENLSSDINTLPGSIRDNHLLYANLVLIREDIDLQEIVDLSSFNPIIPEIFNFQNLPLWMFYISIVLDQHLKMEGYNILGNLPNGIYILRLQEITRKYIEFEKTTEIEGLCPDVIYLNAYAEFSINKESKWIDIAMKSRVAEKNKYHYWLFLATMLNGLQRFQESLNILSHYNDNDKYKSIFSTFLIITSNQCDNIEGMKRAYKLINGINVSDQYIHYYYIAFCYHISELKDFIVKIQCENPATSIVLEQLILEATRKNFDKEAIINNLEKSASSLRCHALKQLADYGLYEFSLNYLRKYINEKDFNADMAVYLQLLKKNTQYNSERYRLLKEIRKNGFNEEITFLQDEYQLACACYDYVNAEEVIEILYKKQPENKQILLQYISILNMLDDKKDIHNLLDLSKTISWDENSIKVIVHSFILNERYQEALDMAFEYASSGSQKGKDLYFQIAEFNCDLHNIVNHDYDFIFDGAYVKYIEKDEEKIVQITNDGTLSFLIGKQTGEYEFDYWGQKRQIKIIKILNKYAKKLIDIIKDTHENMNSTTMQSIDFGENLSPELLLDFINKSLDINDENQRKHEIAKEEYKQGEYSLMNFWANYNRPLPELYNVTWGDFELIRISSDFFNEVLEKRRVNLLEKKIILDISSLILLFEMQQSISFDIKQTIYITKATYEGIRREISMERYSTPAGCTRIVYDKLNWEGYSDNTTYFYLRFTKLKEWIDNNCQIEIVEERLNLPTENPNNNIWHDACMEGLCKCRNNDYILVTEDIAIVKKLLSIVSIINVETLCKHILCTKDFQKAQYYIMNLKK